jgi:hypothetical protein
MVLRKRDESLNKVYKVAETDAHSVLRVETELEFAQRC